MPETAKKFLTADEWGYWYEGKPAASDIKDPVRRADGQGRRGRATAARSADRIGNIACWNTVMDEDRYLTRKWNEFVAA